MSADNWAVCPRCRKRKQAERRRGHAELDALYGTVPVEKFRQARHDLAAKDWTVPKTFREDYEIYGAEDGVVRVSYGGSCSKCGLSLTFGHKYPLDVDGES